MNRVFNRTDGAVTEIPEVTCTAIGNSRFVIEYQAFAGAILAAGQIVSRYRAIKQVSIFGDAVSCVVCIGSEEGV